MTFKIAFTVAKDVAPPSWLKHPVYLYSVRGIEEDTGSLFVRRILMVATRDVAGATASFYLRR